MRRLAFAASALLAWTAAARGDDSAALVRALGETEVNWAAGTIVAQAGAPPDLQLPGPDSARPAALRAAKKRALATLAEALVLLPLGGARKLARAEAEAAAERAKEARIDYQSSGGVLVAYELPFAAIARTPPEAGHEVILSIASMPLEAAPEVVAAGASATLGSAVYRLDEAPREALPAKRDKRGRLVLTVSATDARKLEGAHATIFVRSIAKR